MSAFGSLLHDIEPTLQRAQKFRLLLAGNGVLPGTFFIGLNFLCIVKFRLFKRATGYASLPSLRGIGFDALFSEADCEVFAHFGTPGVVDMQSFAVMTKSANQNVAMRLRRPLIVLRRVEGKQIVVSLEAIVSPFPAGLLEALDIGSNRHRQDDSAAVAPPIIRTFCRRNLRRKFPMLDNGPDLSL